MSRLLCLAMPMSKSLPAVGSLALLDALTDFVPDDFINSRWPIPRSLGPRLHFSAAQLWRTHLLSALGGGRSFNAVLRCLAEQRPLRRFAHLLNEHLVPDARMLHEFRARLDVSGLRLINDHLVQQVLRDAPFADKTVGLIDATDLPARTRDKKKKAAIGVHKEQH
jgi:hypothetical protein